MSETDPKHRLAPGAGFQVALDVIVAASTTTRDGSFRGRCGVSGEVACQPSFAAFTSALTRYGGQAAATAGNLRLAWVYRSA